MVRIYTGKIEINIVIYVSPSDYLTAQVPDVGVNASEAEMYYLPDKWTVFISNLDLNVTDGSVTTWCIQQL